MSPTGLLRRRESMPARKGWLTAAQVLNTRGLLPVRGYFPVRTCSAHPGALQPMRATGVARFTTIRRAAHWRRRAGASPESHQDLELASTGVFGSNGSAFVELHCYQIWVFGPLNATPAAGTIETLQDYPDREAPPRLRRNLKMAQRTCRPAQDRQAACSSCAAVLQDVALSSVAAAWLANPKIGPTDGDGRAVSKSWSEPTRRSAGGRRRQ